MLPDPIAVPISAVNKSLASSHVKVIKGVKIRNRYNQVPYLTQYTDGKVTNSQ